MTGQSQQIRERLAKLLSGENVLEDTTIGSDDELSDTAVDERLSAPVVVSQPSQPRIDETLLDKLENNRKLLARGFDEEAIRSYLKRESVWNALRFTLYDGQTTQIDDVRRRAKTLFPHVELGSTKIARELVSIVKLVDKDDSDLSPAQRKKVFAKTETGFIDDVEDAITVRRDMAMKKNPIIGKDEDDAEAKRISSARTIAEQKIFDFETQHGLSFSDELRVMLVLARWRGYEIDMGGDDWIHVWKGRSATSRIDRGVAVWFRVVDGQAFMVLAKRTDVDAIREDQLDPTSRTDLVLDWLRLTRPVE